jgi:hypothetical protein
MAANLGAVLFPRTDRQLCGVLSLALERVDNPQAVEFYYKDLGGVTSTPAPSRS